MSFKWRSSQPALPGQTEAILTSHLLANSKETMTKYFDFEYFTKDILLSIF
jgi:hypothetical protein